MPHHCIKGMVEMSIIGYKPELLVSVGLNDSVIILFINVLLGFCSGEPWLSLTPGFSLTL